MAALSHRSASSGGPRTPRPGGAQSKHAHALLGRGRRELETLGFDPTGVFPIAVDTARVTQQVERPSVEAMTDDRLVNFLFVGRIAPNKKIEDHIKLAEVYKR